MLNLMVFVCIAIVHIQSIGSIACFTSVLPCRCYFLHSTVFRVGRLASYSELLCNQVFVSMIYARQLTLHTTSQYLGTNEQCKIRRMIIVPPYLRLKLTTVQIQQLVWQSDKAASIIIYNLYLIGN